jgi:hypothetical protein
MKYLHELGMTNQSNLIIHHPKSSIKDVAETKKISQLISHFSKLHLSYFSLAENSQIYNSLTLSQKQALPIRKKIRIPKSLSRFYTDVLIYKVDNTVSMEWDKFETWYTKMYKDND